MAERIPGLQRIILLAFAAPCSAAGVWSAGTESVEVDVAHDGTYTVSLAGAVWLKGGVNQTLWFIYENHVPIKLTGVRTTQGTQGRLGSFSAVELELATEDLATRVSLVFTIKYFGAHDVFIFEQRWPRGLDLSSAVMQGVAAAFPRFDLKEPATAALSAITWSGEMSGGNVCHAGPNQTRCAAIGGSKAASGFAEGADAPLVLLESAGHTAGNTLILSAFDQFGHQRSQVNGARMRVHSAHA